MVIYLFFFFYTNIITRRRWARNDFRNQTVKYIIANTNFDSYLYV